MDNTLYIHHESGATHSYAGRRYRKLRNEILAGRSGPEVTALIEAGYRTFLNNRGEAVGLDELQASDFEHRR